MIQKLKFKFYLALVLSTSCGGCSHKSILLNQEKQFAPPSAAFKTSDPNQVTIAVVGINDFHGSLLPKERKLPDGRLVKSGGADALAAMIQVLREEMQGRVAIIDGGDEWQGTLESNLSQGATVVQFYNRLGVNVAAIGNHEFDFGIKNLSKQFKKAKYGYVASNIFKKNSLVRPSWNQVSPSLMFEVSGIKIGVIGFSTVDTPTTTRYENVAQLDFRDPVKPVMDEAKTLREKGANLVLVTAHAGTVCNDDQAKVKLNQESSQAALKDWAMWSEKDPAGSCDDEQEIYRFAMKAPLGVIDGIISGHTHQVIHHFLNHIPVIQDEAFNQFFNIIYFTFDKSSHKVIPELTRIEGLIPICLQTFEGTAHCDVRKLAKNESPKLEPAYFHGVPIINDAATEAWLKPIRESTDHYRKEVIAYSELPLTHYRDQESPFGNLMSDLLREKAKADFGLVNAGGIRTSLDAGAITYDGLFRALPFDNLLNIVTMTGKQVKLLYRLATSGTRGLPGISGVKLTLIPLNEDAKKEDLNQDGKFERWENNRLILIETSEGKPILDDSLYTVATYDYLVTGGDDLKFVMDQIPKSRIARNYSEFSRDIATEYLKNKKTINTALHPLVDPKHPRFIFR